MALNPLSWIRDFLELGALRQRMEMERARASQAETKQADSERKQAQAEVKQASAEAKQADAEMRAKNAEVAMERLQLELVAVRAQLEDATQKIKDLQEPEEECVICFTIEFRRSRRTLGVWSPFCPKCHMPALLPPRADQKVFCSARCGWEAQIGPVEAENLIRHHLTKAQ